MAKISQTLAISTGGGGSYFSNSCFFYHISSQQWSIGPELKDARGGHACHAIRDHYNPDKTLIVVASGEVPEWPEHVKQPIQVLDLDTSEWKYGETLQGNIKSGKMMALSQHEILFIGQNMATVMTVEIGTTEENEPEDFERTIIKMICFNQDCKSANIPEAVSEQRMVRAAIIVPEHLVDCEPKTDNHKAIQCHHLNSQQFSNGICEEDLNSVGCFYDGGDCYTTTTTTTEPAERT